MSNDQFLVAARYLVAIFTPVATRYMTNELWIEVSAILVSIVVLLYAVFGPNSTTGIAARAAEREGVKGVIAAPEVAAAVPNPKVTAPGSAMAESIASPAVR